MKEIINGLLNELEIIKKHEGLSFQSGSDIVEINKLTEEVYGKYRIDLNSIYKDILLFTNGFNYNGIFLYGTQTQLIQGYNDRYIDGLIDANEMWHTNEDFINNIYFAESDLYLFGQSIETKNFLCHARDTYDYIIFETNEPGNFFEKILNYALRKIELE